MNDSEVRKGLEEQHGKDNVWDTEELKEDFVVTGFLAPFISCTRKSDGKKGSMEFIPDPRFYFDFKEAD